MLPVSQLRAFAAVVEIGTVTGAASALGRTQPQISRLVAGLEETIGFDLFARDGRRLVLTRRGARLYEEVKYRLDSLDSIQQEAERIRDDAETGLRILAPSYIAHTILPRALAKFRSRYPKRHYSVEIVARGGVGSWVAFHSFDIGIAALPFELPAIKVRPFAAVQTLVVLPKGHPLARMRVIKLPDLASYPFVATNRNTSIRKRLDGVFEREGIRPAILSETTSSVSACDLVAHGLGVTIVDAIVPLTNRSDSIEARLWKPGLTTELGFIYPAAGAISAVAEEFSTFVEDVTGEIGSKFVALARR